MEKALIDTSILIEPFTKYRKNKKSYRKKVLALLYYPEGKNFIPAISISILGELYCIFNKKRILLTS